MNDFMSQNLYIIISIILVLGYAIYTLIYKIKSRYVVKKCLEDDGIEDIDKYSNDSELINRVKEYYDLKEYNDTYLKEKLILLNNNSHRNNILSFTAEIGIVITLIAALFANTLTILGKFENIGSDAVNSRTIANQQIEEYTNRVNELSNNDKKSNDELVANYRQKIIEIQDKMENDEEDNKKNFNVYLNMLTTIKNFVSYMLIAVIGIILIKVRHQIRYENINVAINIHKSVIEEQLKKLEDEKLIKKKEDQIEKDIGYLKEKISEYKYKTEVFEDILKVKANEIN